MNERVENLVLEQLRSLRSQNAEILSELRSIKNEMAADRAMQRGLLTRSDGHRDELEELKVRVSRVERRLELTDET